MKLSESKYSWTNNTKFYKGKYKKFKCNINYSAHYTGWYYLVDSNDERDIRYNSLWDNQTFNSKEECVTACQNYINEVNKNAKISSKLE